MSAQDSPAFLDTSYIVRYLTNSPPAMAAQAAIVIDSDEPLVLTESILLETAFVLGGSVYKVPREGIVEALMLLVQKRNIHLPVLSTPSAGCLGAVPQLQALLLYRCLSLGSGPGGWSRETRLYL